VHDKINAQFPSFEKTSGWSIHGQYDSMPADVEAGLKRFFEPFNGLLEGQLGGGVYRGDAKLSFDADGTQNRMLGEGGVRGAGLLGGGREMERAEWAYEEEEYLAFLDFVDAFEFDGEDWDWGAEVEETI
jgi:hypothetical protein